MANKDLVIGLGVGAVGMGALYYLMKLQNEENCKLSYQRGLKERGKIITEIERKYEKILREKDEKIEEYQERISYIEQHVDLILDKMGKGKNINDIKVDTGFGVLDKIVKDTFKEKCTVNLQEEYLKIARDESLTVEEKQVKVAYLLSGSY